MMRSMYSGVSGLKVHQTRMDVIGNNISNVNTVGFKSSSVTFSDVLYQTSSSASGPNADVGTTGQNAKQIGLGSTLSSISTAITTSGGSQRTDNPFDLMIEGNSFFILSNGGNNYFSKAGAFQTDANGTLCNASGYAVMGWQVDPNDDTQIVRDKVSALKVTSAENLYNAPEATTDCYFSGNIDSQTPAFSSSGVVSNFMFYDSLGRSYTATIKIEQQTETNKYNVGITDILDSEGKSILTKADSAITGFSFGAATYTVSAGTVTAAGTLPILEFDASNGKFKSIGAANSGDESITFHIDTAESPFKDITVDFSTITMYANSGNTSIEPTRGSLEGKGTGCKAGNMTGASIDSEGRIFGVYDNGTQKILGQIAVASFANAAGLESIGGSLFATTRNSGDFDGVGKSIASDGGKFNTGVLEMSNVDLASEFTSMITTQRGFQANSRIITTSDTLLEELINLKR